MKGFNLSDKDSEKLRERFQQTKINDFDEWFKENAEDNLGEIIYTTAKICYVEVSDLKKENKSLKHRIKVLEEAFKQVFKVTSEHSKKLTRNESLIEELLEKLTRKYRDE